LQTPTRRSPVPPDRTRMSSSSCRPPYAANCSTDKQLILQSSS
jgi:hypothetical protein